ncbi:Uma2 family endonuclease [Kitasatospora sp. NBC_01250]|uniref:Uma2 family endonuclease n=1 Tax=unclassified Kitasatospora TaxID=2633591 RepID=UPI002E1582BA|nr:MULTISPECIES: Uma2 family endonuclease [unclassified Kitasatospora]WSJ66845.1 Uma2 family endonuclease [Kitasatospora sp. NBC_01302]
MIGSGDRAQLWPEAFEELARAAHRVAEGLRLEYLDGKLRAKPGADGSHATMVGWLTRVLLMERPEAFLHKQGLRIPAGYACPDRVFAVSDAFAGLGEWASAGDVLMAVEATAGEADADRSARVEKPRVYAVAGIPVYLLIDRDSCEVKVYSEPDGVRYENLQIVPFGKSVTLPDPVGITLETEPLKEWVR